MATLTLSNPRRKNAMTHFATDDVVEAGRAFLDKRTPTFCGR